MSAGGFRPTATSNPCRIASGGGGQPGMATSTGTMSAMPALLVKLGPKMPPETAQAPTATTRFGVGMASYVFLTASIIWSVKGPTTSKMSAERGLGVIKNPSRCML